MTELSVSKPKILVIKLADLGDVLTATPALRALRETYPQAQIDLLLTHHTQGMMRHSRLVDNLIVSDNFRIFSWREAWQPHLFGEGWQVLRQIRRPGYDAVCVLHHLTTWAGALKYATLAKLSGAKIVAGLAFPGLRSRFLSHALPDEGFGAKHEIEYWLGVVGLIGATSSTVEMELPCPPEDDAWANLMLTIFKDGSPSIPFNSRSSKQPVIIIHPGSGGFSTARRWLPAHFAQVADVLAQAGAQIVLVGNKTDNVSEVEQAMQIKPINLMGQTSLPQLGALLQGSQLFIGGDSGVSHLAAASGCPMISIFGPTNAHAWGPLGSKRIVLQADVACGPCAYVKHHVGLRHGCEAKTCLQLISPESVITVAQQILKGQPVTTPLNPNNRPTTNQENAIPYPGVKILGVRLHVVTFEQTVTEIERLIQTGRPHQVTTVNPEFVVEAQHDLVFRRIINRATLAFPDGTGLLKASRWLGRTPLPERVAGVDVVEALAALSATKGYRLYFLGAQPGVADQAATILAERYPGLVVVGVFAGSPLAKDEATIVTKIQAAQPDVVLVAYGAPRQDKWIARNMSRLPASVLIGVGGAFDFISGTTQRAPRWMQRLSLEWLHRFLQQPWRWRRIWNAVPRFMSLVYLEKIGWRNYDD